MRPAEAWHRRGLAEAEAGRLDSALDCFDQAVAAAPDFAAAHGLRAAVLQLLDRLDEALSAYDQAIAADPADLDTRSFRASLLYRLGRHDQAMAGFGEILASAPDHRPALFNYGLSALAAEDFEAALAAFERLSSQGAATGELSLAKARTLKFLGREEEAIALVRALAPAPQDEPAVQAELGALLGLAGRSQEALAPLEAALRLDTGHADAHHNRGLALLRLGRFDEGFREFEWRGRIPGLFPSLKLSRPQWDGAAPIAGKRVFVHWEQGFGDTLQFCRYLPLLRARGAEVVFSCQDRLARLMRSLGDGIQILGAEDEPQDYDYVCPLLSLPLALGPDPRGLPPPPYLSAETEREALWRERLGPAGLKIGVAWQGSRKGARLGNAFPLSALAPVAAVPGVRLISLQSGEGAEQAQDQDFPIESLGADFDSGLDGFIDAAAVMGAVDLIVCPDTALAHLAGALNRPVWLALRRAPDWRWLEAGETSPWYPSMRLFRQDRAGAWSPVFERMASDLAQHRGRHDP